MKKRNTAIRALSVFLAYAMVCTSVPAAGQEMFGSGVNRETEENTSDLKEFQSSQADEFGTDTGSDAELFGSDDAKQEFQDGENSEEGTDGIRYIKGRPLTEEERKEELEPFKNLKPLDPGIEVESDLTSVYAAYGNREAAFPSSYDARKEGLVTPVKNQNPFGTCWAFGMAAIMETSLLAQNKEKMLEETKAKMSLDDLFSQIQSGNMKELDIIVKADVQGSVEAVKQSLVKLSNEEVVVKVIHGGVGAINESDVILASASNAIIIGFNVRPDPIAKVTADNEGVDIRLYKVIYNAIEDVEAAMKGMLDPVFEEKVIGHAEIRQIFKASGVGNIAGSYVLDGVMERGCKVRISREGEQIFEGDLASLKRFKDDVKEVKAGYECGLVFDGFNDIQELDQVEAYKMVEVPR